MRERAVARRYAKALFDLAMEAGEPRKLLSEVERIARAAREVPSFLKGLSDERVDVDRRIAAARSMAGALGLGRQATNLLLILVQRGRARTIGLVAADLLARVERHECLAVARANVSDAELVPEAKRRIEETLTRTLSLKSRCDVGVDPTLLGGFEAWIGDVRYDASIKGKIERLKEELDH